MLSWLKGQSNQSGWLAVEMTEEKLRQLIHERVREVNHVAPNCPNLSPSLKSFISTPHQKATVKRIWAEEVNDYLASLC